MRFHLLSSAVVTVVVAACGSTPDPPPAMGAPEDFYDKANVSCVLECDSACADVANPWTCPSLGAWAAMPHAAACGEFDGESYPAVVQGHCSATEPSGAALAKAQILARPVVLPDGRRLAPAGRELVFESDGGLPSSMLRIPGTRFIVVSDYGYELHSLRVIDTELLRNGGKAVVARITYPPPAALDYGLAYVPTTGLLYASSGAREGTIFAYDLDRVSGGLKANAGKNIKLPAGSFPSAIDASADGQTLVVAQAASSSVLVVNLTNQGYGAVVSTLDAGSKDVFSLHFDPNDPTGSTVYATCWTGQVSVDDASKMRLVRLDLASKSVSALAVGKQPEEVAFIDERWMVVANALGDTLSLIDRPASRVAAEIKTTDSHGPSPTTLAYDARSKRLYVTLAQQNAVGVFSVDTATPMLTPIGAFPTAWWPTAVSVDPADGTVFVLSGRGHGIGSDDKQYAVSVADAAKRMGGSIAAVPMMDDSALADATLVVARQNEVAKLGGYPTVDCAGAAYDFPISQKPEDGPSTRIKHVFFIVRENKTFDAIMGGQPGVDGKADLVLAPGNMNAIWPNAFAIASQFSQMDNYYVNAEQSIQGHAWTVFGRTTDYAERRWVNIWGRGEWSATSSPGVGADTTPAEGNVFEFLSRSHVSVDNQGEFIGGLAIRDGQWPGGSTAGAQPDTIGACYEAWRLRAMCDPKQFTYSWLPNDHTFGFEAGRPNPAIMIATNDEATGMYVDALSHSPFWKDSLVIVIEDDPSQGGDHVDVHRTIALFASPWIKRRYVSHAHYDLGSLHKLISDIYGLPYRNTVLENAPLPLDLFTSTPDYSPFVYVPRKYGDASCNPGGTSGAKAAEGWKFALPDNQPGLSEQVQRALGALPPQGR